MNPTPPPPPRSVESILASRYWLTEKGWEATEAHAMTITLTDKGIAATDQVVDGARDLCPRHARTAVAS